MQALLKVMLTSILALVGTHNVLANQDVDCRSGLTPEARLAACTAILSANNVSSKDMAKAYRHRAAAYAVLRREEKAVADYTQAIRLKPDYGLAYVGRGNI
ncbi:MAG: hypothetical protein ACR2O4_03480, partial [Hyphomicrobiaceae bacterium]